MIYQTMPKNKRRLLKQEICAPHDGKNSNRLGAGILKEGVIHELPSKKVISYALS
jgi:hypothetical protein